MRAGEPIASLCHRVGPQISPISAFPIHFPPSASTFAPLVAPWPDWAAEPKPGDHDDISPAEHRELPARRCLSPITCLGKEFGDSNIWSKWWVFPGPGKWEGDTHHFPFVPAVCSDRIWRLRPYEIPWFVQEMVRTATSIKEKKKTKQWFYAEISLLPF